MTILLNLQNDINQAVNRYEASQDKLSKSDALVITKIREMVKSAELASMLLRQLKLYTNKISGKFFSFLPFVDDLKRDLLDTIKKPDYQLGMVLIEENVEMFRDNRELREEIINLKNNNSALKELADKVSALESELELQRQTMRTLMEEREILLNQNEELKADNKKLIGCVEQAETKMKVMEQEMFKLVDENIKLLEELEEYKQKLNNAQKNVPNNHKEDEYIYTKNARYKR